MYIYVRVVPVRRTVPCTVRTRRYVPLTIIALIDILLFLISSFCLCGIHSFSLCGFFIAFVASAFVAQPLWHLFSLRGIIFSLRDSR